MTPQALTHPATLDSEGLHDFIDALPGYAQSVEKAVHRLRRQPDDQGTVAELFRAVHNIKGDAALCRVEIGIALAHPVESILSRLRNGELRMTDGLAECILLTIDRLELGVAALRLGHSVEPLRLNDLAVGLAALEAAGATDIDNACADLIELVSGFRPARVPSTLRPLAANRASDPGAISSDLWLFRRLAQQLDARSPLLRGRSGRLLRLVMDTNELTGSPIDPVQLEAATHFHDIGMMFLPDGAWLKTGSLNETERKALHEHPVYAAELLARIPGWEEASRIVREHHEMPDGRGYPTGLASQLISPGAKLLAIADAFEAVMLKQSHRGKSRSLLRAAAEVNANPDQFAAEWMLPFNQVIRKILERA